MFDLRIIRYTHKLNLCRDANESYLKDIILSMEQIDSRFKKYRYAHLMLNYFVDDLHIMLASGDRNHREDNIHSAARRMYRVMKFIKESTKHENYTPRQINMIVRDLMYIKHNVWLEHYPSTLDFAERLTTQRAILATFSYAIDEKIPIETLVRVAKNINK